MTEREILTEYTVIDLLDRYEWVAEAQWGRTVDRILAMQNGTLRALGQAMGGVTPPDLPTYEQMLVRKQAESLPFNKRMPSWMHRFEESNYGGDADNTPPSQCEVGEGG